MTEEELASHARLFAQFASFADDQGFAMAEDILSEVFG